MTFALASSASGEPACALIIGANSDPFCSSAIRRATGVFALKNATQLAVIAAWAPAPVEGSAPGVLAGPELEGGCEFAEEGLDDGLELPELPQAVSANPDAITIAIAPRPSSRVRRYRITRVCRRNRLLPNVAVDPTAVSSAIRNRASRPQPALSPDWAYAALKAPGQASTPATRARVGGHRRAPHVSTE